jgi:hypothetical protein
VIHRGKKGGLTRSLRTHVSVGLAAAVVFVLFAPGAQADHTAGGAAGGSLLPDLKTKEPERFSIVQTANLYLIDPSASGFPSVGGSHQTWSRSPNLVTGHLVYDITSLGTKRGCADSNGTSPWTGTPHAGKIVLMDRGDCAVSLKVNNAAAAGAVAAVIANNLLQSTGELPPNFSFGGGALADDIAAYTITLRDGNKLKGLQETTSANTDPASPNALNAPATIDPATSGGELRLRLDNEVGNTHPGPLELVAAGSDSDCDGTGSVGAGERIAFQRLYQDGSSNDGVFNRGQDTFSTDVPVGCFEYHAAHDHIHFGSFATYELRQLSDNVLVSSSEKVTFCIADIWRVLGSLPGSPASAYYTDCNGLVQGLSAGWSDEYPYTVAGQHLVLNPGGTYVGDGDYCVVSVADPSNLLSEDNNAGNAEANNSASVRITLSGNGSTVQTFPGTSCGGVGPESWSNPSPPPPDTTPPVAPSGLTASPGDGQVSLDWANNSESDLGGYRVYRSSSGGSFSLVSSPTTSAHTDTGLTNGITYSYYVTAVDGSTPPNESVPSSTVSATPAVAPPAPTVKSYNPSGYTIAVGSLYGSGALSRLYSNNGERVQVTAASGSPRVSELQPYTAIAEAAAVLDKLTINFDAGVSSSSASLSFRVCKRNPDSSCTWETVASYGTGTTSDRSFTWTTTSPAQYVSPSGEIRASVRGTRNSSSSFRTRTDWVRFTIEY